MQGPTSNHEVDYDRLAELLKALAYPLRLELLGKLRTPQTLGEIEVVPRQGPGGKGRPAARQTVQSHLDTLAEAELVTSTPVEKRGVDVPSYRANPVRLYGIMEELRSLIVRYAGHGLEPDRTATLSAAGRPETASGPRLVLVHGVYEGRAYPLTLDTSDGAGWLLGRAKDVAVSLDYDPFVSHEAARVTREGDGFAITDLGSKNGTWVNWGSLEAGERADLRSGDIVGVGRSLLAFAES